MKRLIVGLAVVALIAPTARADTFGTGGNTFNIDFVPISYTTNPASGYGIVNHAYRMGTYEITNAAWEKFKANLLPLTLTGIPPSAYGHGFYDWHTGTTNVPTNCVSWYDAAQFVNWLNTSTGHQAAYNFTGAQGQRDYALGVWPAGEADGGTNLYRHKDAFYFLPTEDEWVKAAYFNGTMLQDSATKAGGLLAPGDGTSGTGWNYFDYAYGLHGPWNVGSGSEELNGTYDMMGNAWEWMESPFSDPSYGAGSPRGLRGGRWGFVSGALHASSRYYRYPASEDAGVGFRVASIPVASVPEPGSITLLVCGLVTGLIWWRRRRPA